MHAKFVAEGRLRSWWRTAGALVLAASGTVGTACAQQMELPKPEEVARKLGWQQQQPVPSQAAAPARPDMLPDPQPATEVAAPAPTGASESAPAADTEAAAPAKAEAPAEAGSGVVPASCTNCGASLPPASMGDGGCAGGCVPGHKPCDCCFGDSPVGRFFGGLYECICCPDPCYEPHWMPVADSAFFLDAARPKTQMRLRWDEAFSLPQPDKAEYFWAKQRNTTAGNMGGKGPSLGGGKVFENRVDYRDLSLYTEAAADRFGAFVEMPYRQLEPDTIPGTSGFADMNAGIKSLLLDCELMQLSTQFKTYIPIGNFTVGLGTGHVSLEPSLLMNVRLDENMYLQSQLAYWIPIGGDQQYEGNIFHYHFSLNRVLWKPCCDIQLVGSAEFGGYEILNGLYTDPTTGAALSARGVDDIFYVAPGIRLFICDKIDIGVGVQFTLTPDSFAEQTIRTEFRWRF